MQVACCARCRTGPSVAISNPAKMPMMAITVSNSINVKPSEPPFAPSWGKVSCVKSTYGVEDMTMTVIVLLQTGNTVVILLGE